jgi:hypothetical protein
MSTNTTNIDPRTIIKNKFGITDEVLDNIINTDVNNLEYNEKLIKTAYEKAAGTVDHHNLINSFKQLNIPYIKAEDRRSFQYRQEKQPYLTPEQAAQSIERHKQYRSTPQYKASAKAYRDDPEIKEKNKEIDKERYLRRITKKANPDNNAIHIRKNANESVRSKAVKKVADHFKIDEPEVERILSVQKYDSLTEPEKAVRVAYLTEHNREFQRQKYKEKREAITRRRREIYNDNSKLNKALDTFIDSGFFNEHDDADIPDADASSAYIPDADALMREDIMDYDNNNDIILEDIEYNNLFPEKNDNIDDEDIDLGIFDDGHTSHKGGKKKSQKRKKSKKTKKTKKTKKNRKQRHKH